MEKDYITSTEAARRLNVSRMLIARRIRERELATFENPLDRRQRLLRRADVDALQTPQPIQRAKTAAGAAA